MTHQVDLALFAQVVVEEDYVLTRLRIHHRLLIFHLLDLEVVSVLTLLALVGLICRFNLVD